METPETDGSSIPLRRPACDNCKARKTKCDRKLPCSGCVALQVECRTTKKSPERRQRVLISDKYTDAVLDVNQKLNHIAASLDKLNNQQQRTQSGERYVPSDLSGSAPGLLECENSTATFRGESSFEAHAKRLRDGLERASGICIPLDNGRNRSNGLDCSPNSDELSNGPHDGNVFIEQSLPPAAITLSLLRLITVEQQRFFIDVPVIDEPDFTTACQQVYFSPKSPSTAASMSTIVGLYYLIHDLQPEHYSGIGLTTSTVQSHLTQLEKNIFTAIQKLNLCVRPSFEYCQALALLSAFSLKSDTETPYMLIRRDAFYPALLYHREIYAERFTHLFAGYIETAWRLTTSAVRLCMDVGMHSVSPPSQQLDAEEMKRHSLFWWLFAIHQSLALALGRPPVVHIKDAETKPGHFGIKRHAGHDRLYSMFIELPSIIESINEELFSATALKASPTERNRRVQALEVQLLICQQGLKEANRTEPAREMIFLHAALMLEIILHTLLTLVQYPSPSEQSLQSSNACLESSRKAIEALIAVGKLSAETRPTAWSNFLNMTLAMAPFVPLIALVGNVILTSSQQDLTLLDVAFEVMRPVAVESPHVRSIMNECESLYRAVTTKTG